MYLNELMYNSFSINNYERFLLEIFNINLNHKENLSYLIEEDYHEDIHELLYYGNYLDDNFNEIELYVVELRNIENYKSLEDLIFNLLSLNQSNHAIVGAYDKTSNKWFITYLFLEYIVEDNKLNSIKSKINEYLHWFGFKETEDFLNNFNNLEINVSNLKNLFKVNTESQLITSLSDLSKNMIAEDSYNQIIEVLVDILKSKKPKSRLKKDIYDKIIAIIKDSDEKITIETIIRLYNHINLQKSISLNNIKRICDDTLIEYLYNKTCLSKEDITSYVKYSCKNRSLLIRRLDESIKNGGKTFTNIKLPLTVIYNIDLLDNILNEIKILDFSINSGIVLLAMSSLISKLKYINKIIQGYTNICLEEIYKNTIKNNIYGITLNRDSLFTTETLLNLNFISEPNLLFSDALNLYEEYTFMNESIKKFDIKQPKSKVLNEIIFEYNKTHMHSKININFEEFYTKEHGYSPLIWQLDYKEVFENGHKFDIIISNVEQKNLTGMKETKKQLKRYKVYENDMRYEYYFIEKAIELIDNEGIVSLIISDDYKKTESDLIRKLLSKQDILSENNEELIFKKKENQ